jgi:xanthine dehydrogenase FAD-binding subunit
MFSIKKIYQPITLAEALEIYTSNPQLKIIAGGTDVLISLHHGKLDDVELLSIKNLTELTGINYLTDGTIEIGTMTTFTEIFRNEIINKYIPILAEASVSMGGPQIRNNATIGGNICNGAVSADSAPTLFVLNADLRIVNNEGVRIVPITEFYAGPGKVKLQSGEILTHIIIKKADYKGMYGKYIKFSNRKAMDIAMLSVATLGKVKNNKFTDLRIALGVSAPTPIRCTKAESFAFNKTIKEELIKQISEKTLLNANPRHSWRGSKVYREHLIQVLTERALKEIITMSGGKWHE